MIKVISRNLFFSNSRSSRSCCRTEATRWHTPASPLPPLGCQGHQHQEAPELNGLLPLGREDNFVAGRLLAGHGAAVAIGCAVQPLFLSPIVDTVLADFVADLVHHHHLAAIRGHFLDVREAAAGKGNVGEDVVRLLGVREDSSLIGESVRVGDVVLLQVGCLRKGVGEDKAARLGPFLQLRPLSFGGASALLPSLWALLVPIPMSPLAAGGAGSDLLQELDGVFRVSFALSKLISPRNGTGCPFPEDGDPAPGGFLLRCMIVAKASASS